MDDKSMDRTCATENAGINRENSERKLVEQEYISELNLCSNI